MSASSCRSKHTTRAPHHPSAAAHLAGRKHAFEPPPPPASLAELVSVSQMEEGRVFHASQDGAGVLSSRLVGQWSRASTWSRLTFSRVQRTASDPSGSVFRLLSKGQHNSVWTLAEKAKRPTDLLPCHLASKASQIVLRVPINEAEEERSLETVRNEIVHMLEAARSRLIAF